MLRNCRGNPSFTNSKRPVLAESSHSHPSKVGVASVRYTPIPAARLLESELN
jgi:hypothetical protein